MAEELENTKKDNEEKASMPIDSLFAGFKKHIEIEGNSQILFSSKFGIGKTYFLRKFFKRYEEEYFLVHLHPSAYQIASNDKIIDFIKTDILTSILKQNNSDTKSVWESSKLVWESSKKVLNKDMKECMEGIKNLSREISNSGLYPIVLSLGKVLKKGMKGCMEGIKNRSRKISNSRLYPIVLSLGREIPYVKSVVNTLESIIEQSGIITEGDIKNNLKGIDKKKVLIVDDLDRLDPEHIFRIANVFSAFIGEESNKNTEIKRLGFDSVIFVADEKNLKSIFRHKYGKNTEHHGYFDKFYNINVFEYNPKEIIHKYIDRFRRIDEEGKREHKKNKWVRLQLDGDLIGYLLIHFLERDRLNLRQIFTCVNYETRSMQTYYHLQDIQNDPELKMRNTVSFLIETMGTKEELINAVENALIGGDTMRLPKNKLIQSNTIPFKDTSKNLTDLIFWGWGSVSPLEVFIAGINFKEGKSEVKKNIDNADKQEILNIFKELFIYYIKGVYKPLLDATE